MKHILLVLVILASSFGSLLSQTSDTTSAAKKDSLPIWIRGGFIGLNFNQVSLTNWAQGGESSISGTSILTMFLDYKDEVQAWDNLLDLAYGFLKSEDLGTRKNEDKIDISSKYGYKAFDHVYYSALLNLKTQFSPGYNYPNDSLVVSKFMAPGYLIASVGLDYKPNDYFSLYVSPATGRFIIVNDQAIADLGVYGNTGAVIDTVTKKVITPGETFRTDFGAFIRALYKNTDIWENIGLESKLELFNNYTDKNTDNRKNIDVNWENKLVMKVNEYIAANLYVLVIYDQDIKVPLFEKINGVKTQTGTGMRTQVKEALGIGFSVKF